MCDIFFDHQSKLLSIHLSNANFNEVNGWLLKSDGTLAQKLNLFDSAQLDCSHLQAGNWFVKIEMPGYTGLKKFTIISNSINATLEP
ncbi:MAG: hypothetical protein EAY75_15490 [Bacteroidetes bacterium]|nr:MAG: hypothetical protein EAY75_15490 [Bacteroidota bacterium]